VKRREFITLIAGAAAASPLAARAQQPKAFRRIGALLGISEDDPQARPRLSAFLGKLHDLGWDEGKNFKFDVRFGGSDASQMQGYAKELTDITPDVILTQSNLALSALQQRTNTIPIVATVVGDPVGSGFIKTLSRPGGNITGFTSFEPPMAAKWLQLLKEVAPEVTRVGVMLHEETAANVAFLHAVESASSSFGTEVTPIGVHDASEIERATEAFGRQRNGGLIVFPNPITNVNREFILTLADRNRLPAVYAFRYFAASGGLISYGIDVTDLYRRAAVYTDRILKGEKPGDLPVQQPVKFEFVINLKTAKALGLKIPLSLQASADEVIE
jgi:ABC-type uncharacterized transport system substrate-binding protein